MPDPAALTAPAAARNRTPIATALRDMLPASGLVLEIASGTGEHAAWFATDFPGLTWQPSDKDATARASIAAWRSAAALDNLLPPLAIDAAAPETWPLTHADAMLAINMVHISPWSATEGLLRGAAALLAAGAPLILYGPFREHNVLIAPSNEAFDASLRSSCADWGLRQLEDVKTLAARSGFTLRERRAMPANNLLVCFARC